MEEVKKKPRTSNAVKYRYNTKTYDTIKALAKKEDKLPARIELASRKREISKAQYIIEAIKQRLQEDGIVETD